MNQHYSNLWLSATKKEVGCGYHFCVTNGALANTAYKTAAGLKAYIKRTGLKMQFVSGGVDKEGNWYKSYRLIGEYKEKGFYNVEEIPAGFTTYYDLSNGSYVPCYHGMENGIHTIYRPNPNSEKCYKSCQLPLKSHIEYSRVMA